MPPALAGINDDRFDGNILFSMAAMVLVPPKVTYAKSLARDQRC